MAIQSTFALVGALRQLGSRRVDDDLVAIQHGHVDAEQDGAHRNAGIHERHSDRIAARGERLGVRLNDKEW